MAKERRMDQRVEMLWLLISGGVDLFRALARGEEKLHHGILTASGAGEGHGGTPPPLSGTSHMKET